MQFVTLLIIAGLHRMKHRIRVALILLAALGAANSLSAQGDALNLPTDLYVLLNEGIVERYGIGVLGRSTITPEGTFVIDFGISQDGAQIAYRAQDGLYIAPVDATASAQLVDPAADVPPVRGRGDTIAWSPDGNAVAFTTLNGAGVYYTQVGVSVSLQQAALNGLSWSPDGRYLVGESNGNIWWIYKADIAPPTLQAAIPSSLGTAWVNNSQLAFAPAEGGLLLMDLDAQNRQIALLDTTAEYRLPYLAPDGRLFFFRRQKDDEAVPEGYGQWSALTPGVQAVDTLGANPIAVEGLQWTPGGTLMVSSSGGVMALFDPSTGQGQTLPVNSVVAFDWGPYPPRATAPAAQPTPEAIFPERFPTLDPATQIPGIITPTQETFATAEVTAE
jgi:hypothetical protein